MKHLALIWVWEGGRWTPWPAPGLYGPPRSWQPIDTVASSLRILSQLLGLKKASQRVLVEQAAWVWKAEGWAWVVGPRVVGEVGTISKALSAHLTTRAAWAHA